MTSFLKSVFAPSLGTSGRAPSFNDFSLHVGRDAESELDVTEQVAEAPAKREELRPRRTNVWQETFSPQMNSNMRHPSAGYYDAPKSGGGDKSVWEHIVKADTIRHAAFDHFDTNKDGVIDAADLRAHLGADANVDELIRQADKNNDGKIDQSEFCELLKSL